MAGSLEAIEDEIAQAAPAGGHGQRGPPRRRRHQRVRRDARRRLRRRDPRLQRPPGRRRARGGRARRRRDPLLRGHLQARSTSCAPRWRACSSPRRSRTTLGTRRGPRRSSAPPRSARSPAPTSPTARSRAGPRCGWSAMARSSTTARSQACAASTTTSREVAAGFECGIVLARLPGRQGRRRARGLRDASGRARARLTVAAPSACVAVLVVGLHFPDAEDLKAKRKELSSREGAATGALPCGRQPKSIIRICGSARR